MKCFAFWTIVAWLCGPSFAFAIPELTALSNAAVVVPNVNRTVEGGGGSGLLNTPLRHQIVYDASLFIEVMRVGELRLRPSAAFGRAFTSTIPNLQINLSTTSVEPDRLNRTFAQNVGTNDTVVFQGPLTISSRFVGPANGPKEFDIIIPLTTPFLYDPGRGNLLIDFRNNSGSSASFVDLGARSNDEASRVFATTVGATSATAADSGAEVFQIVYTPQAEAPPLIFAQPLNRFTFLGQTVSLTVGVSGSPPLNYQWMRGDTELIGETNSALILTNIQSADAGRYSVVVSNAYGVVTSQSAMLTISEGSRLVVPNVSETIDAGSGSGLLNTQLRHQVVYDASLFPVEIMRITELRMRPSAAVGSAFTATISNLQINLSTTSVKPDHLNGTFAQNVGTNETVVFQGPLTVSSGFVGPANGPKEFDIIIPLTTPFLYDPTRGHLLIDFRNYSGSSADFVDLETRNGDGASRVFATTVGATSATAADSGAEVFQIVYTRQDGVPPSIVAEPQSRSVFVGESVSLSVQAVGTAPLEYQWLKEGTAIAGATNAVLTLPNVQLVDAGSYSLVVSNAYGAVTSQSATLTLSESSPLVVPNVNGTVDGGAGSGLLNRPLRHQVVYDDSLFPVEIIRIMELRLRPSARFGNAFTSTIPNLQINLSTTSIEPNALKSVFAQNVGTNDTVVFHGRLTVSSGFVGPANGPKEFDIIIPLMTPFLYDPSRGNLLIDVRNASGSSASYVDLGLRTDDGASRRFATSVDGTSSTDVDSGSEVFQIVYTLQGGSVPSIVRQPQSRGVLAGESVSLTIQAMGTASIEYQWFKGDMSIAGETKAMLTIANVQPSDAGSYSVVVSNAYGVVRSESAMLTVSESAPLVVPNGNRTIDGGSGSGLLNTQLRHQIVYDASLFPVEIMRIAELRMRPSARFGNAFTSTIPNLQINLSTTRLRPDLLSRNFAQNVGTNETVVFQGPLTVSSRFVGPANGPKEFDIIIPLTPPFLYDPSRGNLLIDVRNDFGSSASYVDLGLRTDDGASRLFATSVDATSATDVDYGAEVFQIVYTLHGGSAPSIISQPQSRNVFAGETASLSVQAVGTPPLKYQWLKEGTPIAVGTNTVLTFANVQPSDAGSYSVVVSNAYGFVTSQSAALTLSESSELIVPNVHRTVDGGAGSGLLNRPLRHQVVYDASLFPIDLMRITELRLRPSAAFGSAFTATISNLQINLSTTSIEPNQLSRTFAQNVGMDEVMVFQGPLTVSSRFLGPANGPKEFDIVIPLSTPFLYDRSRGNLLIDFRNASGSSATYVDLGLRTDDGASRLFATTVDATSATDVDYGAEVFQIVYTPQSGVPPFIFAQPPMRATFLGETVTITVGASGTSPLIYQWLRDGTAIADATNAILVLTNVNLSQAGNYSVVVSNAFGTATSQTATLTVSEGPVLVVPIVNRTIDGGGGSGLLNTQLRQQIIYDDSLFPDEIMRITELRMRPSARLGNAFTATISNLQINLSTTSVEPNQLNRIFAPNVGADEVVVFQGPLTVSSRFVGPTNGPKEFDIVIPLTTPFLYDRSRGNLLIDFRNASGSSASLVDTGRRGDDGASRVFATSVAATSSTGADSAAEVFQIVYTPQTEAPPLIFAQPPSRSTFLGETVTFTVGVLGSPPLNYQWGRDGVPIPDATNAILVLTNVNLSEAGNYSVAVSNAFGTATSQTATLTVSEGPVLVVPTVNRSIDGGSGSGLLNTQLRHQIIYDDSLFPEEFMRITELRLRPSARFCNAFTATISNLQINLSTTSVEPDSLNSTFAQNVGNNDTVVFQGSLMVSSRCVGPANGPKEFDIIIPLSTPFSYEPSRGNLLIDFRNGSGSSAGLVDTGQRSDDGASRVFATFVGAASSTGRDSAAEVFQIVYTTTNAPSIVRQPQSRSVLARETASLSVQAGGKAPLKYQWFKEETAIAGATNAVLTFANVQPGHAGSYSVVVSNAYGVVRSQTAIMTISEGSWLVVPNVNRTVEGGGGSRMLNTPLRRQIAYDASLFPVGIIRITELRLRPSAWFGGAFSSTISNLQINLSTTSVEPDHLNSTFAQNVGPDEVVVFHGPLTVSSGFVGPMYGPKEFDIVIPLSTPFVYDSSRGNLLIDIRNASSSSASLVDTGTRTDDRASCVFATSVDATVSTGVNSGAEVFQIVYTQVSNLQVGITNVSGSGRTLALTFSGPAGNYAIEASTNLMDWVILTNIVDVTGPVRVTDPAIDSLRWRFYRARLAP